MKRTLLVIPLIACLTGCLQPKYSRPALPVPPTWSESTAQVKLSPAAPQAADIKWNEFFTDKQMQSVIELALKNNRDLRIAALNVEKVQAQYRIRRAEQFPTLDATATADIYRVPAKLSTTGQAYTYEQFNVGGVAAWELDFFGRIRSLKHAALEQYLATDEARNAVQISLVAAVANTYLVLAADRENLRLAQTTVDVQEKSYELIKKSRDAGIGNDLDLSQSQSQVEAARVDIARYRGLVATDENQLNLLVGMTVPANLLPNELGADSSLKEVSAGLPSDVLLRRPDILSAEHQLKTAYANIGAARSNFFPRIALTAGSGLMSGDLSKLFKGDSQTWSFAPQIVMPIFDAGARRASLKGTKVERDIAVAEYEKSIQSAFKEVSDSLSLRSTLFDQQNAQERLVNALELSYHLAEARYNAGIDSYLSVLVAQQSFYRAQQGLVSVRMGRMTNLVTLYKVLGGGA
ncbi:MAG TPA: efflux transporter outer membrane subunit [Terriglobales bacterium]|nr:efflux transporter outer membrane subunit [Terriglobales bacterium]